MLDLGKITPELCSKYGIIDWGYNEKDDSLSFSQFKKWAESENSKPLKYLQDERKNKRESLSLIFPGFESSLTFLFPYKPIQFQTPFKMANYIFSCEGEDYHYELRKRLEEMAKLLTEDSFSYKTILDVEAVLERDLAYRSSLGWIGKNSMLINRKHGSYFLIGSILFSKKAKNHQNVSVDTDHCGNCTSCIDECPTDAINIESRTLNASKCISTFTIEIFKDNGVKPEGYEKGLQIFGCDICQDVCPWNSKIIKEKKEIEGIRAKEIENFFFKRPLKEVIKELRAMSNREYRKKFHQTSLERTGRIGILKNLIPFL